MTIGGLPVPMLIQTTSSRRCKNASRKDGAAEDDGEFHDGRNCLKGWNNK